MNPPPFPDTAEQEPVFSDMRDGDSDEGEDIFLGSSKTGAESPSVPQLNIKAETTDLFAEQASSTAPTVGLGTGGSSNGVQSDDDNDLFSDAHVELPTENASSSTPSGPRPAATFIPGTADMQTKSMEQLEEEEAKDTFDVDVAVTNPEKVGDGMHAFMAYRVSTKSTLPVFRNKEFSVKRRFSDFLGLYEKLSIKQSLQGCIIPSPPEKSVVGMTKVKVGKDDSSSVEFVERRRAALERYLQRIVAHSVLLQDPDVREFLERDELPRAVNTQALSGAGFLKMINKASDAVNKMTIKMNESDTWFEDKFQEVENEEQQLRKLHIVVDSLVNHRKELCGNTAVFAKSMAMLGNSEDNTALSRALSQLAEVEDKMEQLHHDQAASDFFILAELLADYVRLLGTVRGCFGQRMRAWQRWQEAQSTLQRKREAEAKLLWANKPDKLQQAKEDITEWESRVTQYERDFDRISVTVRKEVLQFEKEKAKDFKFQIYKYLETMLQSQQRLIKFWEAFLPEAKAIA
ncbi:sorting nexin-1 isoform X1 [Gadus morhua]|uniref:PX domain-containing protein n=1 Tax=Gadus morhua TaxID=8049 RepID=A0A8C4Z7T8_GADMO|nr:sorting nexin-1 isoform X1 [Gadus morhua]XP_056464425.1 sorting nexin-1-like isoform X1 [Gadus chalcogrammus]XP_056464426.1 sorting nexin-1-like isoform X1 [Gadus chalcogrammus]XP_056464428.1 sorting nexin-1-like isoform X1 [Gadus chalcogrammus]